jgi:hypothetical protein
MPNLNWRDLVEKAKNAFDASDEQMYLDAAGGYPGSGVNPDEADLDEDDFA